MVVGVCLRSSTSPKSICFALTTENNPRERAAGQQAVPPLLFPFSITFLSITSQTLVGVVCTYVLGPARRTTNFELCSAPLWCSALSLSPTVAVRSALSLSLFSLCNSQRILQQLVSLSYPSTSTSSSSSHWTSSTNNFFAIYQVSTSLLLFFCYSPPPPHPPSQQRQFALTHAHTDTFQHIATLFSTGSNDQRTYSY